MKKFFGKNNVAKLHFSKIGFLGLLFLLCACQSTAVTQETRQKQEGSESASEWSEIWTVVAENYGSRYVFQAPKGTFWFPPGVEVDRKNKTVHITNSSVNMAWHYPSGLPEYVWQEQFLPEGVSAGTPDATPYLPKDYVILRGSLSVTKKPAIESAKIRAYTALNSSLRRNKAQDKGLVWEGQAHKYEGFSQVFYKLLDRKESDAQIIYCLSKQVSYCDLEGIVIDDYLIADYIMVPMRDLENWRIYQDKTVELIKKTIIRKGKIDNVQGERL